MQKKSKKMTKLLKEKVYVFLRIADRQTDKIMYRKDMHMSKHFPLNFTDGRTFERTNKLNYRVASLLSCGKATITSNNPTLDISSIFLLLILL